MGNEVVIEAKLSTKTFEKQIDEVEARLEEIDTMLLHPKEFMLNESDIAKLNVETEKLNNKLSNLYQKQIQLSQSHVFDKIGKSINGVIKKVAKWSLAIIGVRSVYLGIRSAMATLSQYDDGLSANVEYMRWALANAIKPIIEWIIKAMYTIIKIIAKIIYAFSSYNIFKDSGIGEYQKAMAKSNKSAKELKKTLTGFDEMNVLNADGSTGVLGGGGVLPSPDLDLTDIENFGSGVTKVAEDITDSWMQLGQDMQWALDNPEFFAQAFGDWGMFIQGLVQTFMGLWNVITGIIEVVGGVMDIVVGIFTGNFDLISEGWNMLCEGLWNIFKGAMEIIVGLLQTALGLIWGLIKEAWNVIWGLISAIAGLIYDWVIKPVGDFFAGMWNGIVNGAKWAWDGIANIFGAVAGFFTSVFGKAWEGVKAIFSTGGKIFMGIVDGILNGFKVIVNAIITGINSVVAIPFNGINAALNGLRSVDLWGWKPFEWVPQIKVPQIPKLARGGIVNNPGAGVMMGNYIAGERGAEAVLPLTDDTLQRLANMIPVTVQLTNVTELDGRTLDRRLVEVRNNNNFLMNR